MKAVITVVGRDTVGIIAKLSAVCAEHKVNINDISQKVMDGIFVMIMIVDISDLNIKFTEFVDIMEKTGRDSGLVIHAMHEDIFNAMHRI